MCMVIKANICTHLHFTDTRPVRRSTHVAHTWHVNPRCPRLRSLALRALSEQMKRTGSLLLSLTQRDGTTEENDRAVNKKSRGRRECGESQVCQSAKS